jgi:hypothetical protein
LTADIESIRIIDNNRDDRLKAYDDTTDSEIDFNIDSRGFMIRLRRLRVSACFNFIAELITWI